MFEIVEHDEKSYNQQTEQDADGNANDVREIAAGDDNGCRQSDGCRTEMPPTAPALFTRERAAGQQNLFGIMHRFELSSLRVVFGAQAADRGY